MKDEYFENFGKKCTDAAISALISLLFAAILIFAVGAIVYLTSDPGGLITVSSAVIAAVTFLFAGIIGTKKGDSILSGIFAGIILLLIFLALSLIFDKEGTAVPYAKMPYSIISHAIELMLSAAGSFLASKKQKNMKKHAAPRVPKIKRR